MNLKTLLTQHDFFKDEEKLTSFIKILAARKCFQHSFVTSFLKEESSPQQKKLAKQALDNWPKNLKSAEGFFIAEEQLKNILNAEFESEEKAKLWLMGMMDLRMLRNTFHEEVKSVEEPNTGQLLKRWDLLDAQDISSILKDPSSPNAYFLQWARSLKLMDEIAIPEKGVKHFIIHGGLQFLMEERIEFLLQYLNQQKFLASDKIIFDFHTGPRGLSNGKIHSEECLADILASEKFLNVPNKLAIIQDVLAKSQYNGIENPEPLKQELLVALGLKEWPEKTAGWYSKEPESYSASLKNWPVAMDMFEFVLNEQLKEYPKLQSLQKQILTRITVGHGINGRLATAPDIYKTWVKKYGKELDSASVAVITDNSSHSAYRLGEIGRDFLGKYLSQDKIFASGGGAKKLSADLVCDELAKLLFSLLNQKKVQISGVTTLGMYATKVPPVASSENNENTKRFGLT